MSKWFNLKVLAGALFLLGFALYLTTIWIVEPVVNDHLASIKARVDGQVDAGKVKIAFFPLSVSVDQILVKRDKEEVFSCARLSVAFDVSLWPPAIEPEKAVFYRPRLNFYQRSDGSNNLEGIFKGENKGSGAIPSVVIHDGEARIKSPWLPKPLTISSLTADVVHRDKRVHIDVKGQPSFERYLAFARSCSIAGSLTSLKDIDVSISLIEFLANQVPPELCRGVSHAKPLSISTSYSRKSSSISIKGKTENETIELTIPGLSQPMVVEALEVDLRRTLPAPFSGAVVAKICQGTLAVEPLGSGDFRVLGSAIDAKALTGIIGLPGFSLAGPLHIEGVISKDSHEFVANVASDNLRFFYQKEKEKYLGAFSDLKLDIGTEGEVVLLKSFSANLNEKLSLSGDGRYQRTGDKYSKLSVLVEGVTLSAIEEIMAGRKVVSKDVPLPVSPMRVKAFLERKNDYRADTFVMSVKETRIKGNNGTVPLKRGNIRVYSDSQSDYITLSASLQLDEKAKVKTKGKFNNNGGDLSIECSSVHCAAITKLLPTINMAAGGRIDLDGTIQWERGKKDAQFVLTVPQKAFLTVPRSYFDKDESGSFRLNLGKSKGAGKLSWRENQFSLSAKDVTATFRQGGRLSLSADYENKGNCKKAELDFKLANISLMSLLDFVEVDKVEAKGKGSVLGSLKLDGGVTKLHCRVNFPGARLYSFPFSKFAAEFIYTEKGKSQRLHLKKLKALTHNDGKIAASGVNVLSPTIKHDIRFLLENIDAKRLCQLIGADDFSGRGRLRVEGLLEGTFWRPRVKMLVKCPKLNTYFKASGKGYQQALDSLSLSASLSRHKGGWRMEVTKAKAGAFGGELSARGPIQLSPQTSLGLKISLRKAKAKKLATYLAIPSFSLAGGLEADGSLVGAPPNIVLNSRVVIRNARIYYKLSGFNILYEPDSIATNLRLSKGKILLKDMRGSYHGGAFVMDLARYSGRKAKWDGTVKFHAVDLKMFFREQLTQKNDIRGLAYVKVTFKGNEGDPTSFTGIGNLSVKKGKIVELDELRRIEKEYGLRNLIGISFQTLKSQVKLVKSRLAFYDILVESNRGNARGKVGVSFNKKLDGTLKVSLNRRVMSKGHRLLSLIEGGRYFDFKVHLAGTTDKPEYKFSSKGVKNGAIIGGAALFTPLAPAAVIYTGIKKLFGRKR